MRKGIIMRKIMIALLCLGIMASWQIVQLDIANASGKNKKGSCNLAGTWVTESESGDKYKYPQIIRAQAIDFHGQRGQVIGQKGNDRN